MWLLRHVQHWSVHWAFCSTCSGEEVTPSLPHNLGSASCSSDLPAEVRAFQLPHPNLCAPCCGPAQVSDPDELQGRREVGVGWGMASLREHCQVSCSLLFWSPGLYLLPSSQFLETVSKFCRIMASGANSRIAGRCTVVSLSGCDLEIAEERGRVICCPNN